MQVIVDTHITPERIEVKGGELMMYDFAQSVSIYDVGGSKASRKVYQTLSGITLEMKYVQDLIVRSSSEGAIAIYQAKVGKKQKKAYLQKIGFLENSECITCLLVSGSKVFFASKEGSLGMAVLLSEREQVVLSELQNELRQLKQGGKMELEKKSQSQKEQQKYAEKYLQKLFAQREEKVQNLGIDAALVQQFSALSKADQRVVVQRMKSVASEKELSGVVQGLMSELMI